jgi:hypothetical protein
MSKTLTAITITTLCLALSGCFGGQVVTKTEYVVRPPLELPTPEPVTSQPVEWHVITLKNLEEKLKELRNPQGEVVIFALTPEGYQSLSMNAAELRRYIQSLRVYVEQQKKYYERPIQPHEQSRQP